MSKAKLKHKLMNIAPIIGAIVLFAVFMGLGISKGINISYGLKAVINQSIVVATIATGAVFIYTLGAFDISLGANCAVSALIGAMVFNQTQSIFLMLIVCISIAVITSLINSILASVFNLPAFVTTIVMLSVLGAFGLLLIKVNGTGSQIAIPLNAVAKYDSIPFKLLILIAYLLLSIFIFNFTKIGRMEKFVGGNPICAKLSGINSGKITIIAFAMAGLAIGLGAFLTIIYAPTLTKNTASSIGMDAIMAIVFGGMAVSGGSQSKIHSALIGSFSMTLLTQIMTMLNLNSGISQIVKAVIFLFIVYIAMTKHKKKELPR